jgi:O-antigen/teichoic acid export membrane protein
MSRRARRPARRASYTEAAGYGALSFGLMTAVAIGSSIAIARVYGIDVIGEYALVIAPLNIVWYLSSARERPAFIREISTLEPRAPRVTGLFYAMLAFSTALTIVTGVLVMAGTYLLFEGPIGQPDLVLPAGAVIGSYILITNPAWNLDAVFVGFRAGRDLFWIRLHVPLAFVAFAIALAPVLGTVWGLVAANIASTATAFAHRLVVVPGYMRAVVSREELRDGMRTLPELIRFGLKIVPGSIANGISNDVGTWALGIVGSLSAVGAFARAWTVAGRFVEFNWRIAEMLFPTLVQRRSLGDRLGFDRARLDTVRYSAVFLLLPAAAGGGAAEGVMAVFGPGFDAAAPALAILLVLPVLAAVVTVQRNVLLALDRPWLTSVAALARVAVTVAAAFVLAPSLDITGVAIAMLVGVAAQAAGMAELTRRELAVQSGDLAPVPGSGLLSHWSPREMLALALAYVAGFAAARAVDGSIDALAGVIPALLAGACAYGVCFWLCRGINARDRVRLRMLRARYGQEGGPGVAVGTGA